MKYVSLMAVFFFGSAFLFAGEPHFSWDLLWGGSWAESKTLNNRADLHLNLLSAGLSLRAQALDKRPLNFELDPPWGEAPDGVSTFGGGLYHDATGSRFLYGVLDEQGLSARTRNPWLRSAPFPENHKPLKADLKTAVSASKDPEAYLYLSSPPLFFKDLSLRGFAAAQTKTNYVNPDFSGGVETRFGEKTAFLLEAFYAGGEVPARKSNSWFADPPPLPERQFDFYALGLLFTSPFFSISSDWACSETFAWGRDLYGNAGIRFNPFGRWSISLAADGAGRRFTARDGSSPGAGIRIAGKAEQKRRQNSLLRFSAALRSPAPGEDFNRSSAGFYYRFPAPRAAKGSESRLSVSRISFNVDRNASNSKKIVDDAGAKLGFSSKLPVFTSFSRLSGGGAKGSMLGIDLSASLKGHSSAAAKPSPWPVPEEPWHFESFKTGGEISWLQGRLQCKTKLTYAGYAQKKGRWDTSFSAGLRFKYGRLSLKTASPDFPEKWNWTIAWTTRLESAD